MHEADGMSHDHGHDHAPSGVPTSRLIGAAGLNTGFAVVQVVVGLILGSVVVLADAAHQVVDAVGLLTALASALLAARPTSSSMSFGWGKADALGAFVSGLLLLGSIVWIGYESIVRLFDPVEVEGGGIIAIGLVAIAVNGVSVVALSTPGHRHASLSLRAARLHLLTDLAGSFLVVAAGVALTGTDWLWIDPAASLLLSAVVFRATIRILTGAGAELLDRAPSDISIAAVQEVLHSHPGVEHVHHVHVRPLGQRRSSVTAHVVMSDQPSLHEAQDRIGSMAGDLETRLGVSHATLQMECHPCNDEDC